jgi:tetratricopeptide (TPR) repeat protein
MINKKSQILIVGVACLFLSFNVESATAAIFPQYVKLRRVDVEPLIRASANNADKMLAVLDRASVQDLGVVAYTALRTLKIQQPKNAVVLSSLYYANQMSLNWGRPTSKRGVTVSQQQLLKDSADRKEAEAARELAWSLSPNLWLVRLNEGTKLYSEAYRNREIFKYKPAFIHLEKALRLAPKNALCWTNYGGALSFMARDKQIYRGRKVTMRDAVAAWETAAKIDPMRGPWLTLFHTYHFDLKYKKNALRCKREYLKRLPKGFKMNPVYRSWFDLYPA